MPRWVSKRGTWYPGKEKVSLINTTGKVKKINGLEVQPGDPYIYEGADRAALYELFEQKVETLGGDFKLDAELIARVRQLGYKDIDEYAKVVGFDEEKSEKEFREKAAVVSTHQITEFAKGVEPIGGGKDFSGQGRDVKGGFGEAPDLK